MKRVIVTVTNDLVTDQRVKKICLTLMQSGYEVFLVGRKLSSSPEMDTRPYDTHRIRFLFNKGALFYAEYNIRLFFKLLFAKTTIVYANDLDTLPAAFFASRLRGFKLIYDTHELFTEVQELKENAFARKVWLGFEKFIFPKLNHVITVNDSIARIYHEKYGVDVKVMRNLPLKQNDAVSKVDTPPLPEAKYKLILQGSGINIQRGAEEALEAVKLLDDTVLILAGSGDVIPLLKTKVQAEQLQDKVHFIPRMEYSVLLSVTRQCDLGLSLDKDTNLNHRYSLPNKIFDYFKAGIPVLISDLPEIKKVVNTYDTGWVTKSHNPEKIAEMIQQIFDNKEEYQQKKTNTAAATQELHWENESRTLTTILQQL